jgi:hypothetical protein
MSMEEFMPLGRADHVIIVVEIMNRLKEHYAKG